MGIPVLGDEHLTRTVRRGQGQDDGIRVRVLDQDGVLTAVAGEEGKDTPPAGLSGGGEGWKKFSLPKFRHATFGVFFPPGSCMVSCMTVAGLVAR
jgi:hypothetical protein